MSRFELGRAEHFRDRSGRLPPPHFELEQAIARDVIALREEQVGFVPGVDVRDAPAIADDLDRLCQSGGFEPYFRRGGRG